MLLNKEENKRQWPICYVSYQFILSDTDVMNYQAGPNDVDMAPWSGFVIIV